MEHIIYVVEFKRVSDAGEGHVAETQWAAICQHTEHLAVTPVLKKGFKGRRSGSGDESS